MGIMKKQTLYILVITIFLLLIAGELILLFKYGQDTWLNKIGFVLTIIGYYGTGLGFVQKSDILKDFDGIDDMTSPNPIKFLSDNFIFLGIISSVWAVGLGAKRMPNSSFSLGCLGQIIALVTLPILLAYFLFHLLVICPFAYFSYLLASAFTESITGSAEDIEMAVSSNEKVAEKISIRKIISSNPAAAKSFLIGIPAIFLAFITKMISLFFA
ncbi:MAG TPA: hypothetical protein DIW23_05205 [Anaerolineae bacterium]|nr:hypothetical protein [Anaerolineae bacterium]